MMNGLRECDQILNGLWLRTQEDEMTILELSRKVSELTARREEDQNLISSLREENTMLRVQLLGVKMRELQEGQAGMVQEQGQVQGEGPGQVSQGEGQGEEHDLVQPQITFQEQAQEPVQEVRENVQEEGERSQELSQDALGGPPPGTDSSESDNSGLL
jgi:hypothetical protein